MEVINHIKLFMLFTANKGGLFNALNGTEAGWSPVKGN
jgi:hypothetical protein